MTRIGPPVSNVAHEDQDERGTAAGGGNGQVKRRLARQRDRAASGAPKQPSLLVQAVPDPEPDSEPPGEELGSIYQAAMQAYRAGLCPIPASEDGKKRPLGGSDKWKVWQTKRSYPPQLKRWFGDGHRQGFGLVTGAISNNLEMFESEGRTVEEGVFDAFLAAAAEEGLGELIERIREGYDERTPSEGWHLLYHCAEISGSLKLAERPATLEELAQDPAVKLKTLFETKGEGGFTVCAPSGGLVHPTGKPWVLARGGFDTIVTITPEEREDLHALARRFDQSKSVTAPPRSATTSTGPRTAASNGSGGVHGGWHDIRDLRPAERVLAALERAGRTPKKTAGGQYEAHCPGPNHVHGDRDASLSVSEGKDGIALLNCFAGCSPVKVMSAIGLPMSALFPKGHGDCQDSEHNDSDDDDPGEEWELVEVYRYLDGSGRHVYDMRRFVDGKGKKHLRPRQPDGTPNLQGVERVLYQLPDVLRGVREGRRIFVCEGEKDVEAVRDVETGEGHEIATTNPFGANHWNDNYAQALYGAAEVIVVTDKDEAGAERARKVHNSLDGHVGVLRVVEAKEGKDVSDHLEAGLSLDDLVEVETGNDGEGDDGLFHDWTMDELLDQPDHFAWLINGMLCDPTYGMLAGDMKSLKTYISGFILLAMAAGTSVFGEFTVPHTRDVVVYFGEGGWRLFRRRLERIAAAMNVKLRGLPIHPRFESAPLESERFQKSLARDLGRWPGAFVLLDPYYMFHGTQVRAADLHQEGGLLSSLSQPCLESGSSLLVVNHFNETGTGFNLKRITQTGGGQWNDSWILTEHREPPEVKEGRFKLNMDIGSRQWGGRSWELDLNIGRFNVQTGSHEGDITWAIHQAGDPSISTSSRAGGRSDDVQQAIIEIIRDMEWSLSKTDVIKEVGGNRFEARTNFNHLASTGKIVSDKRPRQEQNKDVTRLLWGLASVGEDDDE